MSAAQLAAGDRLAGRFRLVSLLGRGGFGAVWQAVDEGARGAAVAVKVLHPAYRSMEWVVESFLREGAVLAKLDHPGVARVIASGRAGEHVFLAMELIDGETLESDCVKRCRSNRLPSFAEIEALFGGVLDAVGAAHALGIIHRDLKPMNVMVPRAPGGARVKVLDFGIAKALYESTSDGTTVGRMLGSAAYMSPEQIRSGEITPRADVFALGAILFELLTLRKAWLRDASNQPVLMVDAEGRRSNTPADIVRRILAEPAPVPSRWRKEVPTALDAVVARATAQDASRRFADARELAAAWRAAMADVDPSVVSAPIVQDEATSPGASVTLPDEALPAAEDTWIYPQPAAEPTHAGTPTAPETPREVATARPPRAREWSKLQVALLSGAAASAVTALLALGLGALRAPAPAPVELTPPEPGVHAAAAVEVEVEPPPAPTTAPAAPEPAPAPRAEAAPARAARRKVEPAPAPEPAPAVSRVAELARAVERARRANDRSAVRGLGQQIVRAATELGDARARSDIADCADASAMTGDLVELARCVELLAAALEAR